MNQNLSACRLITGTVSLLLQASSSTDSLGILKNALLESFHFCYDYVTPRFLKVLSPAFESPLLFISISSKTKI